MMMIDQPATQLALGFLPIIAAEFRTSAQPPFGNTIRANELAAME
jgi:hypothetical protein